MKIELKDIKKSYQIPGQDEFKVLKGIDFLISQGNIFQLSDVLVVEKLPC